MKDLDIGSLLRWVQMSEEIFCNPLITNSLSLSIIFCQSLLLSLFSPFSSVSVHFLDLCSLLVCYPLRFFSLFNSGICLCVCLCWLLPVWIPQPCSLGFHMPLSLSFNILFYSLSFNYLIFSKSLVGSHLSWAFLILFFVISFLWASTIPYLENFKEEKFIIQYLDFRLQFYIPYFIFFIVVWIITLKCVKIFKIS